MKKLLLITAILVGIGTWAYAETVPVEYFDGDRHYGHNHDANRSTTATVHDKTVDTDTHRDIENEYGVGTDIIIHEGKDGQVINQVHAEYRYDFEADNHKTYVVATSKLSDIWAKVKSIFNRGE